MPRPPVKKNVAPSFPKSLVAKSSLDSPPRRNPERKASERVSDVSDDSEGLVTTINRSKRRKAGPEQDATMSGGLGIGDVKYGMRKPANVRQRPVMSKVSAKPEHAKALEGLKRRRDAALKAQNAEVQVPSTAGEETTAVSYAPVAHAEEAAPKDPTTKAANETVSEAAGAPAMESSVLAIANFKRRPRQPSILRMVQQDSDNDEDASLEDFKPEDESTPLNLSKSRSIVQSDTTPRSRSHTSSSTNPRKRKLATPELQVPRSSPPLSSPEVEAAAEEEDDGIDSQPSLPEEPQPVQHRTSREVTPKIWSETMAPPQSSSPLPPLLPAGPSTRHNPNSTKTSKPLSQRKQPSRKVSTAEADDPSEHSSPEASPPSKTPPPKSKAPKTKAKHHPAPTTASLQTLLPRHRRRAAPTEFDIPSSSDIELDTSALNASDDELTHLPATKRKATTMRKPSPKKRAAPTKRAASTLKQKDEAQMTRTYTRRRVVSSDKENNNNYSGPLAEDGGDSSSNTVVGDGGSELTAGSGKGREIDRVDKEMRALAKKFREVDRWQMEFEEITASSSSPVDAR
ncbi:MAG: hypothetical protein M1835_002529 [Candelina submexicana]|nr:MAG: hypothetical protein M1835_002529 [Candelina submexicana]